MATYTENYNLKMPSGQDAPDVEDFNTNAEIIDTVLKAHSDNTADEYSPDETYTAGRLVIQNNALWKAKQNISVAETWTPDHWESTTLAAELSSLNSRTMIGMLIFLNTSVLDYALSVTSGVWFVALGGSGYTGGDLPSSGSYEYGSAIIMKRGANSINVVLFGAAAFKPIINGYESASWTGWRDFSENSIS